MSDSDTREDLEAKHARNREQRIEAIKRWVAYIESTPPDTWGPQQNAVVDGQLDAARSVGSSADHRQHVTDVATEILEASEGANETSN